MVEPSGLNEPNSPAGSERLQGSPTEDWASQLPRVFKGDRTAHRVTIYFFVFLLLFVGAFLLERSEWTSGPTLHGILETLSTLLAFVVGALALVRFYSKKQGTFLFIGTGFLGTAILDTFSAVVAVVWMILPRTKVA